MRCLIVCDCGCELPVETETARTVCPNCRANYAVTVTMIRGSERSIHEK
jgi:Zn finger protein HypA/HybF involved in hydrogenase expression